MASFAELLNITSGAFGLDTSDKLPSYLATNDGTVPRNFQSENWYTNPSESPYQFAVESVDISDAGLNQIGQFAASVTSLFGQNGEFTEFSLPISPQEISQSEDFAVSVKPTQGGTVIQHSGNKYKTLSISGTTGVAPFRGQLGVNRRTGNAIGQPDDLKFRSGYEVFQHFKAWMKSYHQTKAQGGSRKKLRMIFRNFKDWEFTYVEPLKFVMKRDAQKPLLYNYAIQFKVIGHVKPATPLFPFLDDIDNVLNKAAKAINTARHILRNSRDLIVSQVGEILDPLEGLRKVASAMTAALLLNPNFNTMGREILKKNLSERDLKELILRIGEKGKDVRANSRTYEDLDVDLSSVTTIPGTDDTDDTTATERKLDEALASLGDAIETLEIADSLSEAALKAAIEAQLADALISRQDIKALQVKLKELSDNFNNAIGLTNTQFDSIFDIINTSDAPDSEITDEQFSAAYGFQQANQGLDFILSNDQLFDQNETLYNQNTAVNGASIVGDGIFSFPAEDTGTTQGIVPSGSTLEAIALAELGDSNRWTEIAELNGLKSPYIEDTPGLQFTINYKPRYRSFSDPSLIQDLQVGYSFIVTKTPIPVGGWVSKANFIAEYVGGDQSLSESWRFIFPEDESIAEIQETGELVQFSTLADEWSTITNDTLQSDGVLRPGDVILIPTESTPPTRTRIRGPRDNAITNDLSNSERALAVDIGLTADGDLDLQPNGDLRVTSGLVNGAQAVALKLLYSKGSLIKFPNIGTNIGIGGKVPNIAELRQQVFSSLIQDDRIEDVNKINISRENGTVVISFEVKFVELQDPIPITLPV